MLISVLVTSFQLPAAGRAAAARTASTEPAEPAAAEAAAAAAETATRAAAEAAAAKRTDAAGPVAPRAVAPVAAPAGAVAARHDDDRDDDPEKQAEGKVDAAAARRLGGTRDRDVGNRDVALLCDVVDDPRRRLEQPGAVLLFPEGRRNRFADGLPGVAVGNELLEVVADFDGHLPVVLRDDDEEAVVFALVADAASAVLEHLDGVLVDAAVGLKGGHGGDDDGVAARGLQGADALVEVGAARGIDDVREVVHRVGQSRRCRLRVDEGRRQKAEGKNGREEPGALPSTFYLLPSRDHDLHRSTYSQIFCVA